MTLGNIRFDEIDGQLGVVDVGELPMAIAGTSTQGSYAAQNFSRPSDVIAEYGTGDLVEAGVAKLKDYPEHGSVVLCRVQVAASGTASLDVTGWLGTSVPTVHSSGLAPSETGEYRIKIENGGTRGTDGITYRELYEEGDTYGPLKSLGVATAFTLDATKVGAVVVDLGAGTVGTGAVLVVRTVAAAPTAAEVAAAVEKLGQNSENWDCLEISCPIDPTIASSVESTVVAMQALEHERYWIANARLPTPGETVAAYKTSILTTWSSFSTTRGLICPADFHYVSRVDGRKCRRPRVWSIAPYIDRLPRQVDPADTDNGAIPGVSLIDAKGNPELHDEKVSPGLDSAKFVTAYSKGTDGVFIGNARIKSPDGSDYRYVQHRRVINAGKTALRSYLSRVLNKDVLVSKKTGKLLPSYVRRLKSLAELAVDSIYSVGPMVSGFEVKPDGNTNILQTETLPVDFEVTPKGYIKAIVVRVLMKNPATVQV